MPDQPPSVETEVASRRTSDLVIDLRSPGDADSAPADPTGTDDPPTVPRPRSAKLRLQPDESMALGLQRMALEQFEIAVHGLHGLPDAETGVHQARKALKRVRAVIRMVRDVIGHDVYRAENIVARDVARVLSPVRESFVLARTLDSLLAEEPEAVDPATARELHHHLEQRHVTTSSGILDDRDLMSHLLTTVQSAAARFSQWPVMSIDVAPDAIEIRPAIPDTFSSIEPGIRRVYRRGRVRLAEAEAQPTKVSVHEWRKRVKYLRYQMEALTPVWPEVIGGLERSLNTLSEALGAEHDLADLAVLVHLEPTLITRDLDRNRLLAAIARRRAALQRAAFEVGDLVYAETPRRFTARIAPYWETWHRRQTYAL